MKCKFLSIPAALAMAQSFAQTPAASNEPAKASAHEHVSHEGPSAFEAEFAASDVFRSGSYLQPLWKGLSFEGHYFGEDTANVGHAGAAWTFRFRELKLSPGAGVMFGDGQFATTPAITFRWDFEKSWFVTQGLILQGFRGSKIPEEPDNGHAEWQDESVLLVRPAISDGSHVSGRWKRVTIGGTWEHIHFRENEWKGGGRLAFRILPRVSGVLYVFGPGRVEWRGGILVHPRQGD